MPLPFHFRGASRGYAIRASLPQVPEGCSVLLGAVRAQRSSGCRSCPTLLWVPFASNALMDAVRIQCSYGCRSHPMLLWMPFAPNALMDAVRTSLPQIPEGCNAVMDAVRTQCSYGCRSHPMLLWMPFAPNALMGVGQQSAPTSRKIAPDKFTGTNGPVSLRSRDERRASSTPSISSRGVSLSTAILDCCIKPIQCKLAMEMSKELFSMHKKNELADMHRRFRRKTAFNPKKTT